MVVVVAVSLASPWTGLTASAEPRPQKAPNKEARPAAGSIGPGRPHSDRKLDRQQQQQQQPVPWISQTEPTDSASPSRPARLVAFEPATGEPLELLPGLLDESLLSRGSFAFGAPLVRFDKLKVLGNVYLGTLNSRPLRESYLFRSSLRGRSLPPAGRLEGGSAPKQVAAGGEEKEEGVMRLRIL